MNISLKVEFISQFPECGHNLLHRLVGTFPNSRTQKQSFNIISPVKLHRQPAYLLRGKGSPFYIIGCTIDTVFAVIDTLIRKKNLQK